MLTTQRGWNPQPPDQQLDAHPTEPRPALIYGYVNLTQSIIRKRESFLNAIDLQAVLEVFSPKILLIIC